MAVLFIGFLVASCATLANGPAGNSTPSTSATSTATRATTTPTPNAPGQPVALQDIHMVDVLHGWAISYDKAHILYTTNGGTQWHDVTPHTGWPQFTFGASEFLDVTHAWVTLQTNANKVSIFRTYNGGQTWLETPLLDQGAGVSQLSFADPQNGWLLFNINAATGHQAIDILHTTDGGATWLTTSSANERTDSQAGAIPFSGDKSGMGFLNATTGWVTGTVPINNQTWLYVTHNGGSTWQLQSLPLPANSNIQVATMPPTFFSSSQGIMPVNIFDGGNKLSIYSTNNGGTSWQGSTPAAVPDNVVVFVDPTHGWAAGNTNNALAIYGTSNGGQQWTELNANIGDGITTIVRLSFISQTTGWLLGTAAADTTLLYQTTDGGKTWKHIAPTVVH